MTQKTKAILLIVIVLLLTLGFLSYFIQKSKAPLPIEPIAIQQSQPVQTQEQPQEIPAVQKQLPKEVKGKIIGISPEAIIIDQATGALTITSDLNQTPVFKGVNKEKTSAIDLKAGINVVVSIDQSTNTAIEIVIE